MGTARAKAVRRLRTKTELWIMWDSILGRDLLFALLVYPLVVDVRKEDNSG